MRAATAVQVRISEWVIAGFFSYTTVLSLALPLGAGMRTNVLAANAAIGTGYAVLFLLRRVLGESEIWTGLRNLLPLGLMLAAYKEMGWFAPDTHDYSLERTWIVWDRAVLYGGGLKSIIESTGTLLPSVLEVSYSLVYALPLFCVAALYAARRTQSVDTLLTIYLLGLFLSYVQFPFWPSEPPRTVFAGQDLPAVLTVFRRFNLGLLGSQGIHTSVFPSAHVSGAFAAAFALFSIFPAESRLPTGVLLYAVTVAIATVYGRYHYAVDAAAGFAVAVAAFVVGWAVLCWRGGCERPRPSHELQPEAVAGDTAGRP